MYLISDVIVVDNNNNIFEENNNLLPPDSLFSLIYFPLQPTSAVRPRFVVAFVLIRKE